MSKPSSEQDSIQPEILAAESVADLPDFPYPTYAAFVEAVNKGMALVWVDYRFHPVWQLLRRPIDRLFHLALVGSHLWVSFLLLALAIYRREYWLLWGIPIQWLSSLCASPTPGCLNGCLPFLAFLGSSTAFLFTGKPLFLLGGAGLITWFARSAGFGMGDLILREAMLQSEAVLLWLIRAGVITDVEALVIIEAPTPRRRRRKKRQEFPPPSA
jgi:hypothetical protein